MTGPDFDQLFGDEVSGAERERLRGVHDLLVAAGPPPELSPALESPPDVGGAGAGAKVLLFPRRRRAALLLIAAAVPCICTAPTDSNDDREPRPWPPAK